MPGGHLVGELLDSWVTCQVTIECVQGEEVPQVLSSDALGTAHGADIQDGEQRIHCCQGDVAQLLCFAVHAVWGSDYWGEQRAQLPWGRSRTLLTNRGSASTLSVFPMAASYCLGLSMCWALTVLF